MNGRLFEDLIVSAPPAGRFGRRAALVPLSIAAHAGALALALLFPLLTPAELPSPPLLGPIVDYAGPPPPTPPLPVATPAPSRVTKAPRSQVAAPTTVADLVTPPPAPGPTVSMIEPSDLSPGDAPAPCFINCDGRGLGSDDGPIGAPGPGAPGATGTSPVRISDGIKPPIRTTYVVPTYPEIARPAGISATVVLECTIDPTGHVADARVIAGHPLFNESALDAVRQWRYTPTRLNGVPVAALMTVTVRFIAHR